MKRQIRLQARQPKLHGPGDDIDRETRNRKQKIDNKGFKTCE